MIVPFREFETHQKMVQSCKIQQTQATSIMTLLPSADDGASVFAASFEGNLNRVRTLVEKDLAVVSSVDEVKLEPAVSTVAWL
jgi:hypothetical protein